MEIFFFIAVIALIAVGAYFAHQQQVRRREELARLASERGWQFDSSNDYSHDGRYGHFSVFTTGSNRYANNTLRGNVALGEQSWPVQMGDYHYTTTSHNGKRTTTHRHVFSYVILETPYLGAADLFIRYEGFMDSLAGMLGFDDIDFESKEFSDRFIVKSSDKRFAYDVLHPRMMEFLLASDPPTIEFRRAQCCLTRRGKSWSAADFSSTVDWATEFFTKWPRHVTTALDNNSEQRLT